MTLKHMPKLLAKNWTKEWKGTQKTIQNLLCSDMDCIGNRTWDLEGPCSSIVWSDICPLGPMSNLPVDNTPLGHAFMLFGPFHSFL